MLGYSLEKFRDKQGVINFRRFAVRKGDNREDQRGSYLFLYLPDASLCGQQGQEHPERFREKGIGAQLREFCIRHSIDLCAIDYAGWGSEGFGVPERGMHYYPQWGRQIAYAFEKEKIRAKSYQRVVVIGHGFGALAAIGLALNFPDVISEAHAINPGISITDYGHAFSNPAIIASHQCEIFIPLTISQNNYVSSEGIIVREFNSSGIKSLIYSFNGKRTQDRIRCPVRFVFADMDNDPLTGRAAFHQQQIISNCCPGDDFKTYIAPGCGHTNIVLSSAGRYLSDLSYIK